MSQVRLHTTAIGRAFAVGRHVYVVADLHPRTPAGLAVLAHEAAHAIQQGFANPPAGRLAVDPDPGCEAEATAAEAGAVPVRRRLAPAVQQHRGPFCPNCPLPQWIETGAGDRAVWLPANLAIEAAYAASHPGNTVLFGSQFEGWRDIRLPRGSPNRAADDAILAQLRGLSQQRAPDIIDFTDRTVYEIKTAGTAAAGERQLADLYRLLDAITRVQGGPPFNRSLASWVPPQLIPLQLDQRVCTAATTLPSRADGLLLYQVYCRTTAEEEARAIREAVVLRDLNPVLAEAEDRVRSGLVAAAAGRPAGTDLWIVASPEFFEHVIMPVYRRRTEQTLDLMRVRGFTARENPVTALRMLGWTTMAVTLAAASVVLLVVTVQGAAALPVAAVAASSGAAGGAGGAGGAVVISLAACRAARAAEVVTRAAAGVLFVVSTVSVARAAGNPATVTRTSFVRAVPADVVGPPGVVYELDRRVTVDGQDAVVIGRATVR